MSILLADDHGLFRESIKSWLESQGLNLQIITAASHSEVRTKLEGGACPRLIMLDLNMPGMDGVDSVRSLHTKWPEIPVLVVSANDDPVAIRACIDAGASGFVPKTGEGKEILEAIRMILAGNVVVPLSVMSVQIPQFSEKQRSILRLLADGCGNRDIADRTYLTEGTVKQYVREIISKLDVDNRVQAGVRARQILGLNS